MSAHAFLSASGAHRWLNCPPSASLEAKFEDSSGEAAAEGTAAHAMAEYKLLKALGRKAKKPTSKYDSEEMEDYTDGYVAFILEMLEAAKKTCKDPIVLVEQRLDFSKYVPEGFGTGDCIIVSDGVLHVIDFKYGQGVLVDAVDNPQMMLYGLGSLLLFDGIYDIEKVYMTVYQPRRENINTYVLPKDDLYKWAEEELKPTAKQAFKGEGEFRSGEWCRFCKAAVKCRTRAEQNLALAKHEFAMPPVLTDEDIEEILSQVDDLVSWANDIKGYALSAAINQGKEWTGFKLVEGRSNRKYSDEEDVARAATQAGFTDIYRETLITLTQMEKLMGKTKFNEVLGSLIIKPPGKPTLVPESDKRPAITIKSEFEEEI